MIEKIYEKDAYVQAFEGCVKACTEAKGQYWIELNRTAFFPEGGGQPGDRGFIGDVKVLDTCEKEGSIWHLTEAPLPVGTLAECQIDWDFRYSNMQNHGGEHIVSGIIHRKYGYDNVGFHMGSEEITMDFNGELTWEALMEVEREANRAIRENVPIQTTIPSSEELSVLDYRSKKALEGDVRIVEIPGFDRCACCGTHVRYAGEIHLIKLLWMQRYKGGIRIGMLAGMRALEDYRGKHESVMALSRLFSAKPGEVAESARRVWNENSQLRYELGQMRQSLLVLKAEHLEVCGKNICLLERDLKGNELRSYANLLAKKAERVLLLSGDGSERWNYVLIDSGKEAKTFSAEICKRYQGKGGGSPEMVQGTLKGDGAAVKQWFESLD